MRDIVLPKLNNADDTAVVNEWLVDDGARVVEDTPLVEVETSKATSVLDAPCAGYLLRVVQPGAEAAFGARLGLVFDTEQARARFLDSEPPAVGGGGADGGDLAITTAAKELMERHAISREAVLGLGKKVIRAADLDHLVGGGRAGAVALPRNQRAVARVVAESHRTIPAAFAVIKVDLAAVEDCRERVRRNAEAWPGLDAFTIKAIAELRGDHPLFFASPIEAGEVLLAESAHVGLTVDVGTGLFVPVVREVDSRTVQEIADQVMELRVRVLDESLRDEDLSGGNITLSLTRDDAVVFAQPLIFPGQVCMVSLGGRQETAVVAGRGIAVAAYVYLGVAYDHRVVNGRDAVAFGYSLKELLEDGEWLSAVMGP